MQLKIARKTSWATLFVVRKMKTLSIPVVDERSPALSRTVAPCVRAEKK